MKSFRRMFKSKPKEEKENLDASRHVTFHEDAPPRRTSKRAQNHQPLFAQRSYDDMSNPAAAYHAPTKPRERRPTQSCPGGPDSYRGASSSEDDQSTMVANSEYGAKKVRTRHNFNFQEKEHVSRRYYANTYDFNPTQTSEYGSADPSPVSDVLRVSNYNQKPDSSRASFDKSLLKYKNRYAQYKEKCRDIAAENKFLRDSLNQSHESHKLFKSEVERLQSENRQLMKLLDQCNKENLYHQSKNILTCQQPSYIQPFYYGNQHSYPMSKPGDSLIGAGEHLASVVQMPSSGTSSTAPTARFSSIEPDETKNFRVRNTDSMDDSSRTNGMSPVSQSSMERSRSANNENEISPLQDRSVSLVLLKDDGYSTNQSNQTLSATPTETEEGMETPKINPIRRIAKFRELADTL